MTFLLLIFVLLLLAAARYRLVSMVYVIINSIGDEGSPVFRWELVANVMVVGWHF